MEDEESSISFLKNIFNSFGHIHPGNKMIKWFSLHKALTIFSFRVTAFSRTMTLHMTG
jgi:hypothetical protein